ncbi:1,2-phenylacetyl-CoA epoxidase subunit PaaD [Alkalihalobacillus sp. LMS39]|uniref:1,2-phenylacetyl-CoA epoxidase subunit PaaD n=1 Tax=Alkalihalobacillus sp. LMS39 TaxID=2924032 RepID=UPI001FB54754|nr:1,2-phenylacetyl-CoA epoxidase subunit PaaD [Alkalihalobacillus sp. LMS39]UOE96449.1 phenylacetate-CoA oxygenase subunit PaaJ [Alkalihalobacillus sp. LMS39]
MINKLTCMTQIEEALTFVKDPEIPSVSVVDLGMVYHVEAEHKNVHVKMLPTFVGCPALDIISRDIKTTIMEKVEWVTNVTVTFVFDETWTTERISEEAYEKLKSYGIAPPPRDYKEGDPWSVDCPYCGSAYTTIDNIFGPAACRSILYCKSCKNPFEAMKPIASS